MNSSKSKPHARWHNYSHNYWHLLFTWLEPFRSARVPINVAVLSSCGISTKNSVNTSLQIQEVHFCSTSPASHVAGRVLINVAREGRVGLCMERDPISQSILSVRHMEKNSCWCSTQTELESVWWQVRVSGHQSHGGAVKVQQDEFLWPEGQS